MNIPSKYFVYKWLTEERPTFISCCVSFHFFFALFSVDLILFRSKIKDKTGSGCLLFESCRTEVKLRVGGFGVASVTDHGPRVVGPSNQSWASFLLSSCYLSVFKTMTTNQNFATDSGLWFFFIKTSNLNLILRFLFFILPFWPFQCAWTIIVTKNTLWSTEQYFSPALSLRIY